MVQPTGATYGATFLRNPWAQPIGATHGRNLWTQLMGARILRAQLVLLCPQTVLALGGY